MRPGGHEGAPPPRWLRLGVGGGRVAGLPADGIALTRNTSARGSDVGFAMDRRESAPRERQRAINSYLRRFLWMRGKNCCAHVPAAARRCTRALGDPPVPVRDPSRVHPAVARSLPRRRSLCPAGGTMPAARRSTMDRPRRAPRPSAADPGGRRAPPLGWGTRPCGEARSAVPPRRPPEPRAPGQPLLPDSRVADPALCDR